MALTKVTGGTISTTSNYEVGVITATKFVGPFEGSVTGVATGASKVITSDESSDTTCFPLFVNSSTDAYQAPKLGSNLTFNSSTGDLGATKVTAEQFVGNISGTGATFTTLDVSGTLNYTHVTDVYSVGVATFANNVQVGAGISVVGVSTFGGYISLAQKIIHTGDADTSIEFDTDTIKFETAGAERLSIASNGDVTITNTSSNPQLALKSAANGISEIQFGDANDAVRGNIIYRAGNEGDALCFNGYNNSEAMRINSSGYVGIGNTATGFFSVANRLVVGDGGGSEGMTIYSDSTNDGYIVFADGTSDPSYRMGQIIYSHNIDTMQFRTGGNTERLRIRNDGNILAANDLAVTGVTTSSDYDLSAIAKDISQTAVDVFVYDTRKDSDGGAWRYRTQGTSWYNETLGTSHRGNRKEFPAVAVIVATNSNVMIYDGDDPEMPLWMKFDQYGAVSEPANMITLYSNTVHRVKALNGILLVGMTASSQNEGLFEINFITDRGRVYRSEGSGVTGGYYSKAISERNSQTGIHRGDYNDTAIITQNILSIDMTVLPNSPIDKDTGLPRPSYAVGTDGGATILKSHGEKEFISVDYTNSSSAYRNADLIQFTEDGGFIFGQTHDNGAEQWMYKYDTLGYTDKSISYHGDGGDLHLMPRTWDSGHATTGVELYYNDNVNTGTGRGRRLANNGKILATYYGLTYIDDKPKDHANGMVAYATTNYHTGWMHGDVILATLSDTNTTAPANLVTNGTFDSGTGWSLSGAGAFSISGGKLNGDGTAGDSFAQQAVSPGVVNRYDTYDITFTVTRTAGSISARVGNCSYTPAVTSSGTYTYSVEAGSTTTETVLFYGSGFNGTVDDVSVRRNIQDYSKGIVGSKKGLQMAGTCLKTAAATGSDLVAYSGFSASNYMKFDSFNIGTGDFSVSVWCIPSTDGTNEFILELDDASQSSNRMYLLLTGHNPPRIYVTWDSDVGGSELEPAAWNHIVVGRRSGMGYVYLNGRPISDGTKAFTTSLNGNGMGTIGNYSGSPNAGYAWSGKLALLRISKTMPSTEQVKKMYHDEKKLFQPNAKCTIYGTSSDVNAISYDDGTGIIHAGTGQGRSEFNGFVRINNTTDAIATALSSSNGLVVEE